MSTIFQDLTIMLDGRTRRAVRCGGRIFVGLADVTDRPGMTIIAIIPVMIENEGI